MHSHFLEPSAASGQHQQRLVLILLNWTLPEATLTYWQAGPVPPSAFRHASTCH